MLAHLSYYFLLCFKSLYWGNRENLDVEEAKEIDDFDTSNEEEPELL